MNIQEIPLQELLKDKEESLADIIICAKAIRLNVKYSGGSIQDRLDTNERIVVKIDKELVRRRWMKVFCENCKYHYYPNVDGYNIYDYCTFFKNMYFTPMRKYFMEPQVEEININNSCEHYERKWWKFLDKGELR